MYCVLLSHVRISYTWHRHANYIKFWLQSEITVGNYMVYLFIWIICMIKTDNSLYVVLINNCQRVFNWFSIWRFCHKICHFSCITLQRSKCSEIKVSENDQEISQSQTTDKAMKPQGRATSQSYSTRRELKQSDHIYLPFQNDCKTIMDIK